MTYPTLQAGENLYAQFDEEGHLWIPILHSHTILPPGECRIYNFAYSVPIIPHGGMGHAATFLDLTDYIFRLIEAKGA